MKYSANELAEKYGEFLSNKEIELDLNISQTFDLNSYNEYTYKKLMKQYELLYNHTDSIELTERFLKGE